MHRRLLILMLATFVMFALSSAVALSFCEEGGGEKIRLLITPSALKYTKKGEVKKFNIEVEGGNEKAVIQNVWITGSSKFKIISLVGGIPHCVGFKIEPATPVCQEEVELTEYVGGLSAELRAESTTGLEAKSSLTT